MEEGIPNKIRSLTLLSGFLFGGAWRIRTAVHGFADQ